MVSILVLCITLYPRPVSALSTVFNECTDTYLDQWDWVTAVKGQTNTSDFNSDTMSYIIYKDATSQTNLRNVFTLYYNTSTTSKMTFEHVSAENRVYNLSGKRVGINSEPTFVKAPSQSWGGTSGGNWNGYSSQGMFAVNATAGISQVYKNLNTIEDQAGTTSGVGCIVAAHNVNYAPGWTQNDNDVFKNTVPIGTVSANSCDGLLDIPCYIGKAFTGLQNTLVSIATGAANVFAKLFMPDGSQIKSDFDSLTTSMTSTLGFLAYPITFLVDTFNAFKGTTNNWCTSSSCSKNFGTFMGANVIVNFAQPATTMPTIWTWFKTLLQGLVVLEIVFMVRKRYNTVVSR